VSCHGLQILLRNPRKSIIGRSIFSTGLWEPEVTQFISSKVRQGMTVFDIGADIGYYSLLLAKLVGPTGLVFSFEPIPKAKWYLDKNIEMNGLDNVRSFDFALFDEPGVACLEAPLTLSKINLSKKKLSGKDIQVEMKVFDEWKAKGELNRVDLVKLDVEGAELNVLRGMKATLQNQKPAILVEVHSQELKSFGFSPSDLIEFLSEFGYQIDPVDKLEIDFSQSNLTIFCQS
jgi:FkbM family methyltransferase|tara:strand:- start:174 stop:869 length:696 start_codon:yes stop_codon:yes gene_type:complete